MKPSVGRIVHFYQMGGDVRETSGPLAAIVTHAYDGPDQAINIVVFTELGGTRAERLVSAKEFNDRRYWEWPPRDAAPAPAVIDPKALPAPAVPEAVILSGYVPPAVVDMFDPMRRNDDHRLFMAERAIYGAIRAVEMAGAHPWLTDAVILLTAARNKVADYYDLILVKPAPRYEHAGGVADENVQTVDDTGEDIDPGLRA
jgi:hypothetical protein